MSEWKPIETAPKDGRRILVYGQPSNLIIDGNEVVKYKAPGTHTANWDDIDESFVLSGGSWFGPFIQPTHWMPLPEPPERPVVGVLP